LEKGENSSEGKERVIPSSDGGSSFLELLTNYDVDCLFFNPGSDYYPVLEHLSRFANEGRKTPNQIMCLTEHLALSMAHGYAMATGRAQVVMVHVGLGTMALGGAVHNIMRGREPALIIAGRSPYTFEGELLGGRDRPYHWDQEIFDQLGLLRQFAKWTYELKTNSNLPLVLSRALQIANSEPKGPVYLVLPRELLAEKQQVVKIPTLANPSQPSQAQKDSLEKIADSLLASRSPVILTEYLGRDMKSVGPLVELAEFLGAPVIEPQRKRMNFPTNHKLYLPGFPKDLIEAADTILLLDIDVPWSPSKTKIRPDATILHIDVDPLKSNMPLWGFPVDISVTGSTSKALPELLAILRRKQFELKNSNVDVAKDRTKQIESEGKRIRENLRKAAEEAMNQAPMKVESILSIVNALKRSDTVVVSEGVSYEMLVASYIESAQPGTYFAIGGSSLGDGLGNALGLKLANRDLEVICITGDGGFVYSNPTSVYWAARKYQIPIMTLILNNGGYRAMKGAVQRAYPEGFSNRNNVYSGVSLSPQPDYVMTAKACGASGCVVENTKQLSEVIRTGFEDMKKAKSMVIDAVVEQL
jgi:acetolactate synthase I/II/III large subunit